jgi:4'-phosphopantetheinyl transferase EntD
MPLFYAHTINQYTRLAIWHIREPEDFFLEKVPLSRAITHPHKRLQHLAGRYLLQYLFPDFPIHLIQIAETQKPFLPDESHHFSISHCGHFAAAIVSTQCRVGIDVEIPTPRVQRVAHKFLHSSETVMLQDFEDIEDVLLKTICWSAKETLFKWYGKGNVDFRQHLRLNRMVAENPHAGRIDAYVTGEDNSILDVPFLIWPELVLTYTVSNG